MPVRGVWQRCYAFFSPTLIRSVLCWCVAAPHAGGGAVALYNSTQAPWDTELSWGVHHLETRPHAVHAVRSCGGARIAAPVGGRGRANGVPRRLRTIVQHNRGAHAHKRSGPSRRRRRRRRRCRSRRRRSRRHGHQRRVDPPHPRVPPRLRTEGHGAVRTRCWANASAN